MNELNRVFSKGFTYHIEKDGREEGGKRETHICIYKDGNANLCFVAPIEEKDLNDKKEPLPRAVAICHDGKLYTKIPLSKESLSALYKLLKEYDSGTE